MSADIIKAISDFGYGVIAFATLIGFFWYVLKRDDARFERQQGLFDKQSDLLAKQGEIISSLVSQMGQLVTRQANMQETLITVSNTLGQLEEVQKRVEINAIQIRGMMGDKRKHLTTEEITHRLKP